MDCTTIRSSTEITQWLLLFRVFNGCPEEWASWIVANGSPTQRRHDLPFALRLVRAQQRDVTLLSDLRLLVFAECTRDH